MTNEFTTEFRTPAIEAITPPPTAVPAVRVPQGQPDDTWTDDALDQYGQSELGRSSVLARKSNVARFRAGHAYSIMRKRHTQDGTWCRVQEERNLPRTTVWEAVETWERATAMGHGEKEIASLESWTEVLVAYGVAKERPKKQDVPASVHAEPVANEATVGQGEAVTAGSAIGQEGGSVAAEVPPDAAIGTAPVQDQPHEDDAKAEADAGNAEIEASAQVEPSATTIGTDPGASAKAHCRANPAKARKVQAKEQKELTPCEIDAGNTLLKVAGTWDRAMHVLETLKALAGD